MSAPKPPLERRFVLPLPPNRANGPRARANRWDVRRDKLDYALRCDVALRNAGVVFRQPGAPRDQIMAQLVTVTMYVWALMDDDNCVSRCKWVLDRLVHAGVLRDDKRPWCVLTGIPEQFVDRKNQRLELTLTPVPSRVGE